MEGAIGEKVLTQLFDHAREERAALEITFTQFGASAVVKPRIVGRHSGWKKEAVTAEDVNDLFAAVISQALEPADLPPHGCDLKAIAELLSAYEPPVSSSLTFIADFRKTKGNVFKAQARSHTPHLRFSKLGKDGPAVLAEAMAKLGAL